MVIKKACRRTCFFYCCKFLLKLLDVDRNQTQLSHNPWYDDFTYGYGNHIVNYIALGVDRLAKKEVDEYLQQGIYGVKEIKPEERKRYLGTLRERVIAVLYQSQVAEAEVYPEIVKLIKQHPKVCLFLNGNMTDQYLTKYVELAIQHKIRYKIVFNKDYNTDLGLVLAEETAVNQENIYIEKKKVIKHEIQKKPSLLGTLFPFLKS